MQKQEKTPLIQVENLTVLLQEAYNPQHKKTLVSNLNFTIMPKQTFALLGESGSGKSITALSLLQLLPPHVGVSKESAIKLNNRDLLTLSEVSMRRIRGSEIAMIFQEPMTSLNPVFTIGEQINEALKLHQHLTGKEARQETLQLLRAVQIKDPTRVYASYPHQLSGGMKQRAMIAMALSGRPKLLIADEPTTALDMTTQSHVLDLLKQLQTQYGMAILFITHDLAVAAKMADYVGVMRNAEMVEQGTVKDILEHPKHPYTQQLILATPKLKKHPVIEGSETILSVENLKIYFPIKKGLFRRTVDYVRAVNDVTLEVKEGETLALIGESGSGKTTLAKGVMAFIPETSGKIVLLNHSLNTIKKSTLQKMRSDFQMIFQDPFSAMDPRLRVKDILEEGMLALDIGSDAQERSDRMDLLLEQVGLKPEHKYRYPHQFSGGQRQRICIARALAVGPRLLVCDEPTSSLDVSVQAQIIDLLIQLQEEFDLSYLFITHNFSVVRAMAHRVAVMYKGEIVETGETEEVLNAPKHPYTQALLRAVPRLR